MIRPAALALCVFYWTLSAQAQAPDDVAVRAPDHALVQNAIAASVVLGLSATGLVYLNAIWLSLHAAAVAHSAASSSA